jgi:enoyl-CoA hydratase
MATAKAIASYSNVALGVCKETLARAFESSLSEGLLYERRVFHALFATEDQKEGMAAFVEKRPPNFKHR